jgi:hypothetical protein
MSEENTQNLEVPTMSFQELQNIVLELKKNNHQMKIELEQEKKEREDLKNQIIKSASQLSVAQLFNVYQDGGFKFAKSFGPTC